MEKKHGKEVKIALVALFGLFVLFVGMNFLKGLNIFSKGDVYYISFQDVTGLASSSPIYADGYPVGTVRSIDYDYTHEGKTKVTIDIEPEMRIPKGSSAVIESDMLGNVRVNLLLANNPRERVMPGEVIPGEIASGLMSKAAALIPEVEKMLPKTPKPGVQTYLSTGPEPLPLWRWSCRHPLSHCTFCCPPAQCACWPESGSSPRLWAGHRSLPWPPWCSPPKSG